MKRRDFIKEAAIAGATWGLANKLAANSPNTLLWESQKHQDEIRAVLLHLSYNMWEDYTPTQYQTKDYPKNDLREARAWAHCFQPELTFDRDMWNKVTGLMAQRNLNMVIIDLGDAVKYDSHPEIAVKGAWSPSQLKNELKRLREMGLEPIPKLNFSAGHKAWLGTYQRMLSSNQYYAVCKDVIEEVCNLFDSPRFFHLGMDEETAGHQSRHQYAVIRQGDLWWHDFYYLTDIVEKQNIRPWIWSDYAWHNEEVFFKKMPKSVLQSNWYYGEEFKNEPNSINDIYVKLYDKLEAHGYDQIPTGSNYSTDLNFMRTVDYCTKIISAEHLKGFMQSVWMPMLLPFLQKHTDAVNQIGDAI
ncbi:MAG TPA: Tat pathway signal protein [Porphyromonadaceae bacterium]|nr:Tat pathway signal protein [Porphyromonadaceae bacterium]